MLPSYHFKSFALLNRNCETYQSLGLLEGVAANSRLRNVHLTVSEWQARSNIIHSTLKKGVYEHCQKIED